MSWQVFRWVYKGDGWQLYHAEREPYQEPVRPYELVFQPGQTNSWPTYFDYTQGGGAHVFEEPGIQQVGVAIGNLPKKTMTITVTRLDEEDYKAYGFLRRTKLAAYFNEASVKRYSYGEETVRDLLGFASRFQNSRYALYAKLGSAFLWLHGVEGEINPDRAVELLQEVANSTDKSLAPRAYYYLGRVAERRGDMVDARQYYRQALSLRIDPYFKSLTEQAQARIEQRLSPPKR